MFREIQLINIYLYFIYRLSTKFLFWRDSIIISFQHKYTVFNTHLIYFILLYITKIPTHLSQHLLPQFLFNSSQTQSKIIYSSINEIHLNKTKFILPIKFQNKIHDTNHIVLFINAHKIERSITFLFTTFSAITDYHIPEKKISKILLDDGFCSHSHSILLYILRQFVFVTKNIIFTHYPLYFYLQKPLSPANRHIKTP